VSSMQPETIPDEGGDIDFGVSGKIVLLSGLTLSSYALFGLSPVLPAIAAHFSAYPNAGLLTRMLISAVGIVVAVSSPIVGAIADRVGPRRVLLVGLTLYVVAGCAPFFLRSLYAILLSRVIVGLAVAAVGAVILVILVTHSSGSARNRWLGYLTTTATIVSIFYAPVVGYIGSFGWRWVFLTFILAFPLIGLTLLGIAPDAATADSVRTQTHSSSRFSLGTPLNYIVFVLLAGTILIGPAVYVPFRLREIGITSSSSIGLLLIPASAAGVVAGFSYGWIRAKLSIQTTFMVGFCAMALGLFVTAAAHEALQAVAGQILTGFGTGINMPSIFLLASVTGPDAYRARTMGFTKSGVFGGPMIAQLLFEPIVARTTIAFVLCLFAASSSAFALYYARQSIQQRRALVQQTQLR
jgi:MFS family permease